MKTKLLAGFLAAAIFAISMGMTGCGSSGAKAAGKGTVILAGSTSVQPLSEAMAEVYMDSNPDVTIEVQGGGSGQGIKSIEEKIADIGALSRKVKDEEKAAAAEEFEIARDGIAIVVNKATNLDNLTIKQIKEIYMGKITNWKDLGGVNKPITVVSREAGSGTRGAFTEITGVLEKNDSGKETDQTTKDALVQPSTGAVKKTVANTPNSIGYVSLNALDASVKTVKVEGTEATIDNVLSGDYKIQRPFVYAVNSELSGTAKAFIDFAMGAEGQKIVEENGFIPVN